MCNCNHSQVWYVVGKWRHRKWKPAEAYQSKFQARHNRLRTEDIRRARFKYVD